MDLSAEIAAFIRPQPVARLATADSHGQPHVVPVCFVYENASFYIAIDEKPKRTTRLKRLRNIEANPQAALVIDVYHDDWSQLAWVMVQGTASIHDNIKGHPLILVALRQKYPQYRAMALETRPLIQVVPQHVTSWGQFS